MPVFVFMLVLVLVIVLVLVLVLVFARDAAIRISRASATKDREAPACVRH